MSIREKVPFALYILPLLLLSASGAGCGKVEDSDRDSSYGPSGRAGSYSPDNGGKASSGFGGTTGFIGSKTGGASGSKPSGFGGSASGGSAAAETGNTNISLSGSQDFGLVRAKLTANQVPAAADMDASGFFAEHHAPLPMPDCGERVCLQPMLAVMGNLTTGSNCTMLQIGLNSPIVADPTKRPPLSLAVVVDVSGSMQSANKIDFVRTGLQHLVDGMRDGDRLSIVTYNESVKIFFPMQEISLKRGALRELVRGLVADGGTNIHDGLKVGFEQLRMQFDPGRQNRVVMLSDGQPTAGITNLDTILQMSKSYNSEGIGLTTVGLGTDFNVSLMRGLAQQGDGNFYFLENAGAVTEVFSEELSYFTVPIALDLKVTMKRGSYYTVGRAYGSPMWQTSKDGGSLDIPSVFLAHRVSHKDQTPDGGRRGGGSALLIELMPTLQKDDGSGAMSAQVATLELSFREPGTNRRVVQTVDVNFPLPPWMTPDVGFFWSRDVSVLEKSFVMLNIYAGLENAAKAFHSDRTLAQEHITMLRRLVAAVMDYNEEVRDEDIADDILLLNQMIRVMIANGVRDPAAVPPPANPWPRD